MSSRTKRARASHASSHPLTPRHTTAPGLAFGGVLDALPAASALTLVAAIPAYINLATDQIFEEQKSLLLLAAVLVALPGALAAGWRGERLVVRNPIVLSFVALVVVLVIAASADGFTRDAIFGAHRRRHGLLMWAALAVIFIVMCANSRTEEWRRRLVLALILGSVWPSAYLLIQRFGGDPFAWVSPGVAYTGSTFGNRVLFAGYLSVVIPVTMMQALRVNWWWILVAVLQYSALIGAGSRGGALAAGASAFIFAGVYSARDLPRRTVIVRLMSMSVVGLLLVSVPQVRETIAGALNASNGSARVRVVIWNDVLSMVRASGPRMFIGHGPESLRRLILPHYSAELGAVEQQDAMPDRSHNELLDTLVNAGVVGVILELVFFGAVFWAALGIQDSSVRAGLAAAVVAHLVELQFGIASVGSRLTVLAVAALIVGLNHDNGARPSARRLRSGVLLAALVAALSPVISMLPNQLARTQATGTPDDLVNYVRGLANGTPLLYSALLIAALVIAWISVRPGHARRSIGLKAVGVAAAVAAVIPLSLQPTFADTFSSAGATFESKSQWAEAVIAYREAGRRAPHVAYYRSNLGRALIQLAVQAATPDDFARHVAEADSTYRAALAMEPFDPEHSRHLAALFRIRASRSAPPQQAELLVEADRIYAEITAKVPTLTSLWVEWAYVDLDRQLPDNAIEKLDRALTLDQTRADARQLRSDVLRTLGRPETPRD